MKKLYDVPTTEQLVNLATVINNELLDVRKNNFTILFEYDKETLLKIDEEFYYKNNKDGDPNKFKPSDEINIDILGIKFKFIEKIK